MSLKEDWKEAGVSLGHSFAGAAQSIIRSAQVGLDKVSQSEEKAGTEAKPTGLKESWTEVGHCFGTAGKALGNALAETARKAADAIDGEEKPHS